MSDNRVTYHGTMKDTTIINLPDEWANKVDLETLSVTLTPIGSFNCYYNVNATLLES